MQKVLRVLNGRRAGAVFVLRQRTVIGRAGHVDIQLVNETVSRQHARLSVDERGEVVLTDLSSDNGTFVNGEPVGRRVLHPGDTVCVADTRFVFEEVEDDPHLRSSQVFAQRATSTDSLRQTAPHRIVLPDGEEAPKDPGAGQYLRQAVRRPTPPRAPAGVPQRVPAPSGAAPSGSASASEPASESAVPRSFATGAPMDSEDPTYPIALTPPWLPAPERDAARAEAPAEPEPVEAREQASTRPEKGASPRARATAEYAASETVAVPGGGAPASRFDRSGHRHAFRRAPTAEYGATWNGATDDDELQTAEYGADALLDVLAYRHLRLRTLRADPLDARERARFAALERRMEREPEEGEELELKRRFNRFACSLPLRIATDPAQREWTHAGRMLDLSAGGAQLRVARAPIEAGDTIWISIALAGLERVSASAGAGRRVMLEARVIWASPEGGRIGVIFAGEAVFPSP